MHLWGLFFHLFQDSSVFSAQKPYPKERRVLLYHIFSLFCRVLANLPSDPFLSVFNLFLMPSMLNRSLRLQQINRKRVSIAGKPQVGASIPGSEASYVGRSGTASAEPATLTV